MVAAGVDAGSLIANTATATFTANSTSQSVDSNTVTLTVDEILDAAVVLQESGPVSADSAAVLRYKVTNTGNGPEAFTLTADPAVSGNAFDATVIGLAIDTNHNGIYDAGVDIDLANGGTSGVLAADGAMDVLVRLSVPASAMPSATSKVELTARAMTGSGAPGTLFAGAGVSGGDAVVGASGAKASAQGSLVIDKALVTLAKSATVADPFGGNRPVPAAVITYTILASVGGTGSVNGLSVNDVIPAGTTYQPGTLTIEGTPMSDANDGDAGEANATAIAVQLGTLAAGATRTVTFKVKID